MTHAMILEAEKVLHCLIEQGRIEKGDVQAILEMNRKAKVWKLHPYEVFRGKGKDQRWFTYVADETKANGRRKVGKKTEEKLLDYLYELYYDDLETYKDICLAGIYHEWLEHKKTIANRSNYIRRIDSDFKKYYLGEELSATILVKPLKSLTKVDIEKWAHAIVKKHNMTRTNYYNMSLILRHVLEYMVDKEVIDSNVFKKVKVNSGAFRKVRKKNAESQVYFPDEATRIIERAYVLADEKQDESYLAIPLFFQSGIRIGECLALSFHDFVKEESIINVQRSFVVVDRQKEDGSWEVRQHEIVDSLKHNAEVRRVLVVEECFQIAEEVQKIQLAKGTKSELLFNVKTPAAVTNKLFRICDQLGIPRKSPHKIRKTYISSLINNGVDLDFVREQVGHRELKTTLDSYTYSTTRKEQQLQALTKIFT